MLRNLLIHPLRVDTVRCDDDKSIDLAVVAAVEIDVSSIIQKSLGFSCPLLHEIAEGDLAASEFIGFELMIVGLVLVREFNVCRGEEASVPRCSFVLSHLLELLNEVGGGA